MDQRQTRIGARRLEITDKVFRINGKPMFLRGVNRHQEYPYVGYATSPAADFRDAKRIKEAGFDFVRLSHYPQSPAFMAAADELGLVLLDAVLGWQYLQSDPRRAASSADLPRRDSPRPQSPQRYRLGVLAQRDRHAG